MKYLLITLLFLGFGTSRVHDFHVSILMIEYNAQSKGLECSFKIFIDDLEDGLKANGAPVMHLKTKEENPKANQYIEKFIRHHFKMKANDKDVTYRMIGKEYEDDVCWIYVEGLNVEPFEDLEIKNTLLFNTFEDQMNMVHVKNEKGITMSLVLSQGKPSGIVHF